MKKWLWGLVMAGLAEASVRLPMTIRSSAGTSCDFLPSSRAHMLFSLPMRPNKGRSLLLISLFVGPKEKEVEVAIDTGSSILWVPRGICSEGGTQVCGRALRPFSYRYLDGPIEGELISTQVSLIGTGHKAVAGKATDNIWGGGRASHAATGKKGRVEEASVMLVNSVGGTVRQPLLGLSPRRYQNVPTFLEDLKREGVVERLEFTLDLAALEIVLGPLEEAGRPDFVLPVSSEHSYAITVTRIGLGDSLVAEENVQGLIDSGNTLIALPLRLRDPMFARLKSRGVTCRTLKEDNPRFLEMHCIFGSITQLEDMIFHVGSNAIRMSPREFFESCNFDSPGPHDCEASFEFHDYSRLGIILGQPFLRLFRASFDNENSTIALRRNKRSQVSPAEAQAAVSSPLPDSSDFSARLKRVADEELRAASPFRTIEGFDEPSQFDLSPSPSPRSPLLITAHARQNL